MKKILLLALFCLSFSIQSYSQKSEYSVDWGPSYKKEGGLFSTNKLVGIYGKHYYTLSRTRKNSTLLKFDLNHKLVSNKGISKKFEGEKIYFNNFIDTKKGTYAYMPQMAKGKWKMLISKFDGNDFGDIKEVYSHDFTIKRISLYGMGMNHDATNKLVTSLDDNRVAYTNILSMKEKNKDEEEMVVAIFDAEMNLEWDKRQRFGYKDKKMVIKQTVVDKNGVVYVLAAISDRAKKLGGKDKKKRKDEDGEKSRNLPQFHYSIFRITKDDMEEFKVKIGDDLAPVDIAMYFPDENTSEMIVSGFYTDAQRKSGIKGMFYASGNSDKGIVNIKINEFEEEFIKDLANKRALKKDRGITTNYSIDDFIQYSDGSIGFVAEEYYVTVHTYTDSQGRTKTTYTYHSNELLIPRFSAEGELMNIQKIKKHFSSSSPSIVSYSIALANDKIYLVFNDFKTKDEAKDMKGKRRWRYTDLVVMSNDGEILYNETLFNSKEIDLTFIPGMSDYSGNVLILGSIGRKEYAFGTVELK